MICGTRPKPIFWLGAKFSPNRIHVNVFNFTVGGARFDNIAIIATTSMPKTDVERLRSAGNLPDVPRMQARIV
jgi:hypothetical protein